MNIIRGILTGEPFYLTVIFSLILLSIPVAIHAIVIKIQSSLRKNRTKKLAVESYEKKILAPAEKLAMSLSLLLERKDDPLDLIVTFFQLTSPFSDNIEIHFLDVESYLGTEQRHQAIQIYSVITEMGRSMEGFNRTRKGEAVTAENVYIGNTDSLFTKTVSFIKDHKEAMSSATEDQYEIEQYKARSFMNAKIRALKSALGY